MKNNINANTKVNAIIDAYAESEKTLTERVNFAKTVIVNTLHKFPATDRPEELSWAFCGTFTGYKVVGDQLTFFAIRKGFSQKTITEASIPVELLLNDPVAIAQYARKLIRSQQSKNRVEAFQASKDKQTRLENKIKELETERAKAAKEINAIYENNARTRATIAKNTEKAEKRRLAKLTQTSS